EFVQPERFTRLVRAGVLRPANFTAWTDPATLGDQQRAELATWGRQLVHSAGGEQKVLAAQLYEVVRPLAP
ncbi:MAG: hypothetical protein KDA79_23715, partial [Planctomycetaceae bacterium]|nr:hypothetical protein [Planctomycetaceae bacterium]